MTAFGFDQVGPAQFAARQGDIEFCAMTRCTIDP